MDAAEQVAMERLEAVVILLSDTFPASLGLIRDGSSGRCNLVLNSRVPTLMFSKGHAYVNPGFVNRVTMEELASLFIQELHSLVLQELRDEYDDEDD